MATYVVDQLPLNWNYYEGAFLATERAEITASVGTADNYRIENGGVMTVDTDMLTGAALGAGTPFHHYLQQVYINIGTFLIDGRKVRHIKITGESGAEPTRGDTVTFSGGATGEFMRFHTIDGVKYMKLRLLTGNVASTETISDAGSYAATADSADHVGTLEIITEDESISADFNPSVATFSTRGEWFYLKDSTGADWTGDGTDSQVAEHFTADYAPFISVETGNGTDVWELWYNRCTTPFTELTAGPWGRCFYKANLSTTITFGLSANNKVPPSGARIRVPNIQLGGVNAAHNNWYVGQHTAIAPDGLSFDIDKLCLGSMAFFYSAGTWGTSSATDMFCSGSSSYSQLRLYNNRNIDFDATFTGCGFHNCISAADYNTGYMFMNQNCSGTAIARMLGGTMVVNTGGNTINYPNNPCTMDWYLDDAYMMTGRNNGVGTINFDHFGKVSVENATFSGDGPNFMSGKTTLKNITLYSHPGVVGSYNNHNGLSLVGRSDVTLDGLHNAPENKPQRVVADFTNMVDSVIKNVGSLDLSAPEDWSDNSYNNIVNAGISFASMTGCIIARWGIKTRTNLVGDTWFGVSGAVDCTFQNLVFQSNESVDGYCAINFANCKGSRCKSVRASDGTFASSTSGGGIRVWNAANERPSFMTSDFFFSDVDGGVILDFVEDVHADFSGCPSVVETSNGRVSIAEIGEYAVYESHYILGHTGIKAEAIRLVDHLNGDSTYSGAPGTFYDYDYQIDTGSGYGGTWAALEVDGSTAAHALSAQTIDPSVGWRFKIRLTKKSSSEHKFIKQLSFTTTTTATAQIENLHPLPLDYTFTLENIPSGALVTLREDDEVDPQLLGEILKQETVTSGVFTFSHDGTALTANVQIFKSGIKEVNLAIPLSAKDQGSFLQYEVDDLI